MDYSREEVCLIWLQYLSVASWRGVDKLLGRYGSAQKIWDSFDDPEIASALGPQGMAQLQTLRRKGMDSALSSLEQLGVKAVTVQSNGFPDRLRSLSDPPRVLFYRGRLPDRSCPSAAIIGARRDTRYGRNQAYRIAAELAKEGIVIVSGLARGIDTAAHRGALDAGGITVAFLGNGISSVYPPENRDLSERIAASGGAVISEFAPFSEPLGYHFPIRNRLISGLSDAVLLIEAQKKSGTASTVHHALTQGREVFALPGNVDAPGSELPLLLLKEGAHLCTCAEDILEEMNWKKQDRQLSFLDTEEPGTDDGKAENPVLAALRLESKTFEELLEELKMTPKELGAELTMLELDGKIERLGGRAYALAR